MKISVIGLGKAGLPLAAVVADSGIEVIGVDVDAKKVEQINKGINPIKEEPGLRELIKKYGGKKLRATADSVKAAKESNVHIIIVPLFIDENKKPDFSLIKKALENIGKGLKKNDLVVLETTVLVKTTETLVKDTLEKNSKLEAGKDFFVAYSPERIMTGYSISRFKEFPKLVGGINEKSTEKAFEVYKKFSNPIKVSNSKTAELAKIAEGIYRDVNISLANELFKVSEAYGINFWEMREAAKHEFSNIHEPGNVGGHCIAKDHSVLMNDKFMTFDEVWSSTVTEPTKVSDVEIKEITDGNVLSFDLRNGKFQIGRPSLVSRRKVSELTNVKLAYNYTLRTSDKHPFIIHNKNNFAIKFAKDLKAGDLVVINKNLPKQKTLHVFNLIDIIKKNNILYKSCKVTSYKNKLSSYLGNLSSLDKAQRQQLKNYNSLLLDDFIRLAKKPMMSDIALFTGKEGYNKIPAIIKMSKDFCKFIGYYLAEGCTTIDETTRVRLTFGLHEGEYIDDVKKILRNCKIPFSENKQKTNHTIKISSRVFGEFMSVLDLGTDSYNKKLPSFIFASDLPLKIGLLQGFIRGDGNMFFPKGTESAELSCFSVSKKLILGVHALLMDVGLCPNFSVKINKKSTTELFELSIIGFDSLKKCYGCVSQDNRRKLKSYLASRQRHRTKVVKDMGKFMLLPVISAESISYNDFVYSMEVDKTHTFVTDHNIVVHNCIPIYPWFLINELNVPLIKTARELNDDMINYYAKKVDEIAHKTRGKKIGIIGLSYREGVKEKAYSRSIDFIKLLKKKGYDVYGLDPLYSKDETEKEFDVKYFDDINKMDAIVLMNKEFQYKNKLMKIKDKVVDVKNVLG